MRLLHLLLWNPATAKGDDEIASPPASVRNDETHSGTRD